MNRNTSLILILLAVSMLQGCATAIVGGAATGAAVLHDRRSTGTVIDDQGIELSYSNALSKTDLGEQGRVSGTSYNYVLLLTGQAASAQAKNRYGEVANQVSNVKRVVNEIRIGPNASLAQESEDAYTTTRAKLELTKIDLEGFDATRIKVVTESDVVYLMGLVTKQEADAAVEKIRYLRGVKQVVKVFEYR